jgi:TfoX/Sxy family transcriptional regulator of competence genes
MAWRKSPPELIALFDSLAPSGEGVERRQMFGYPALFVAGNMAIGLHQDDFILRLPDAARERFIKLTGGGQFQPQPGRVMREYVVASKALKQTPAALAKWVEEAVSYARSLQPKGGKPSIAVQPRGKRPPAKSTPRRGGPPKLTVEIKKPPRRPTSR